MSLQVHWPAACCLASGAHLRATCPCACLCVLSPHAGARTREPFLSTTTRSCRSCSAPCSLRLPPCTPTPVAPTTAVTAAAPPVPTAVSAVRPFHWACGAPLPLCPQSAAVAAEPVSSTVPAEPTPSVPPELHRLCRVPACRGAADQSRAAVLTARGWPSHEWCPAPDVCSKVCAPTHACATCCRPPTGCCCCCWGGGDSGCGSEGCLWGCGCGTWCACPASRAADSFPAAGPWRACGASLTMLTPPGSGPPLCMRWAWGGRYKLGTSGREGCRA